VAALTAVALFLAYPPFSLVLPAFLALVPFLWCLEEQASRGGSWAEVMRLGYWFGALANGLVFYWLVIALWHYTPLALAGYLAAILIVLAPGWLLFALAYVWVRRRTGLPVWLVFPLLWTALEWLVGHQGDLAFPWLGLGISLTRVPVLVQFAEIGGARSVTLWLAAVNALVYLAVAQRSWRPAAVAILTGLLALGYGTWREATIVLRPVATVALLQPNVGFREKWEDAKKDSLVVAGTGSKQEDEALFDRIADTMKTKTFTYVPQTSGSTVAAALAGVARKSAGPAVAVLSGGNVAPEAFAGYLAPIA